MDRSCDTTAELYEAKATIARLKAELDKARPVLAAHEVLMAHALQHKFKGHEQYDVDWTDCGLYFRTTVARLPRGANVTPEAA